MGSRISTSGFFSGEHRDDDGSHELNLAAHIASDTYAGTVDIEFESRGRKRRRKVIDSFTDPVFARKMAFIQKEMLAAERGEAHRNREVTPDWKPEKRRTERRSVCPDCTGVGAMGDWSCDECGGQGWISA